jgi:hypothetical protein
MEELNWVVPARRLGASLDQPANHATIANSSGDTRCSEKMVEFSTGVGLLIHRHSRQGIELDMPSALGTS